MRFEERIGTGGRKALRVIPRGESRLTVHRAHQSRKDEFSADFGTKNGLETCTSATFSIFGEKLRNDQRIVGIISLFISSNLKIWPISADISPKIVGDMYFGNFFDF